VTPSNTWFLGPTRVHFLNVISISSAVFAQLTADSPYTLQWAAPFPPQNCPLLYDGTASGPTQVHVQMALQMVQPFLQGSVSWQIDQQTNHATPSATRLHLRSTMVQLITSNELYIPYKICTNLRLVCTKYDLCVCISSVFQCSLGIKVGAQKLPMNCTVLPQWVFYISMGQMSHQTSSRQCQSTDDTNRDVTDPHKIRIKSQSIRFGFCTLNPVIYGRPM